MDHRGVSDLVRDSRLATTFPTDETVEHSYLFSDTSTRRRPVRVVDSWRRQRRLGSGGFGTVWLEACVSGPNHGRFRAVKEVTKTGAASAQINYTRELEAIAKFSHHLYIGSFVKSDGWYENATSIFVAMEYLPFGDLEGYLKAPWPESEAQLVVSQLAQGLVFMHENQFVHRDLKPKNVLVAEQGPNWWVKLADFGICKRLEESTALKTMIGTQGYIAPELTSLHDHFDDSQLSFPFAIDVWALGQIAFRILTNQMAFKDNRTGSLFNYVINNGEFPVHVLEGVNTSSSGIEFIKGTMKPLPAARFTAEQCLKDDWLLNQTNEITDEASRQLNVLSLDEIRQTEPAVTDGQLPEATASWTTRIAQPANEVSIRPDSVTHNDATIMQATIATVDPSSKSWDTQSGTCLRTLQGHTALIFDASFSPDGAQIVSCAWDNTIKIWDTQRGTCLRTLEGHTDAVCAAGFSPDGSKIVSGSFDKTIKLWDTQLGTCLRTLDGHTGAVYWATFSPDGMQIASASKDNTVKIWDTQRGTCLHTLLGHEPSRPSMTAFSPDGTHIVSPFLDRSIQIWDTQRGICLRRLDGHTDVVFWATFSPDGMQIASASKDLTIKIWDTQRGTCLRTLDGHKRWVLRTTFSPDGTQIASASSDETIKIWDTQRGTCLRTLEGHTAAVSAIAFSPDGKQIVSGSSDSTIKIWVT